MLKLKFKFLVYSVLEPAVGYLTTLHFNSQQGTHLTLVWAITLDDETEATYIPLRANAYNCFPSIWLIPIVPLGMLEQVNDLRRHAQHLYQQQSQYNGNRNWTQATNIQTMLANH